MGYTFYGHVFCMSFTVLHIRVVFFFFTFSPSLNGIEYRQNENKYVPENIMVCPQFREQNCFILFISSSVLKIPDSSRMNSTS